MTRLNRPPRPRHRLRDATFSLAAVFIALAGLTAVLLPFILVGLACVWLYQRIT